MKKKATQTRFWSHEDLPLFSGTPPRVAPQEFKPREVVRQYSLLPRPTFDEYAAAMKRHKARTRARARRRK